MSFECHRFDQNSNKNIVRISALKFFAASWELSGSLLGLPWDLVSNIFDKKAYRKPQKAFRKPQGSYKKVQGRNPEIFCWFLEEVFWPKGHFEINWSLVEFSLCTTQIQGNQGNLQNFEKKTIPHMGPKVFFIGKKTKQFFSKTHYCQLRKALFSASSIPWFPVQSNLSILFCTQL